MDKEQKLIEEFFNKVNKTSERDDDLELIKEEELIDKILNCQKNDKLIYDIIFTVTSNTELLDKFDKLKLFNVFDYLMSNSFLFFSVVRKLYSENTIELKKRLLRKSLLENSIPISNIYCFDINVVYFSYLLLMEEFSTNLEFDNLNNNPMSNMNLKIVWDYYANNLNPDELFSLIEKSKTSKKIKNDTVIKKIKSCKLFKQENFDESDFGNYRIFEFKDNKISYRLVK